MNVNSIWIKPAGPSSLLSLVQDLTITSQRRPHCAERRGGAAAVEAAVVLPFVLFLMLGMWEVGRMVEVNAIFTNAVREDSSPGPIIDCFWLSPHQSPTFD